jgi:photosystem II stability/assembly factor-like uncharacterized protein
MNDGGFMAVSPLNSNIVFCTGNVYNAGYFIGVSHSSDGGTTWEHDTLAQGTRGWAVAFDGVDTNRVYVGGDSMYSYAALLITTDRGATWTMSHSGLVGTVNVLLTVPGSSGLVYAGTNSGAFRSTDGGATWSATTLTQQVRTLVLDPASPANIYAGTYGAGVYVSTDGGLTWSAMNDGLTCNKVLSLDLRSSDGVLFAGTEGGSVFRTSVLTGVANPREAGPRGGSLRVSGNPCRGTGGLEFSVPTRSPVRAAIFDHAGRRVADLGVRNLPAGTAEWRFSTSGISSGAYFVRLTLPGETRTARLVVLE